MTTQTFSDSESSQASATDRAKDAASTASEQTSQVAGTVKEQGAQVASDATDAVRNVAQDVLGNVTDAAREHGSTQRDHLVATLSSLGDDLSTMAEQAPAGLAGDLARQLADRARSVTGQLENREPAEILEDVRRFARNRPGTFLLGALGAGVLAGRLLAGARDGAAAAAANSSTNNPSTNSPSSSGSPAAAPTSVTEQPTYVPEPATSVSTPGQPTHVPDSRGPAFSDELPAGEPTR